MPSNDSANGETIEDDVPEDHLETLLSEFSDELRAGRIPDFNSFLHRCPERDRQELCSLMNTLVLADRALRHDTERPAHDPERPTE